MLNFRAWKWHKSQTQKEIIKKVAALTFRSLAGSTRVVDMDGAIQD